MQGQTSNFLGQAIVILIVVAILGYFLVTIIGPIRAAKAEIDTFLRAPLVAHEMQPGAVAIARFRPLPGAAHGVWLDLALRGPREPGFEVFLLVKVGDATLLEGTYPIKFNDEGDAKGLPFSSGLTALNTSQRTTPRTESIKTVLRAFRFDAPATPVDAEAHARIVGGDGVEIRKARLLVTVKDSPG